MDASATPRGVADFFVEVFRSLNEWPRPMEVVVDFSESNVADGFALDLECGEPVFRRSGAYAARLKLDRRWLAEHDVPLTFSPDETRLALDPTQVDRVRVRRI